MEKKTGPLNEVRTVVIMISVGNRTHLSDITYRALSQWAISHKYSCILIKDNYEHLDKTPHFNKLVAHKIVPGYDRYVIVDDDLLMKKNAPPIQHVPEGFIGLCKDAIQNNTNAKHVKWTANTGFIVADASALPLLEEAYTAGAYAHGMFHEEHGIWGPHDQGILNDVLFKRGKIFELDNRWNYQAIISYFTSSKNGENQWMHNRLYRVWFYLKLLIPFSKTRKKLDKIYGLHMTMGVYPRFFSFIYR